MRVTRVSCATSATTSGRAVELAAGLTVVCGPNGAGKTNLLEAVYFGCTAARRGPPTSASWCGAGRSVARVELELEDGDGARTGSRWASSRARRSGSASTAAPSTSLAGLDARPLVSVFLPERLELVKGAPRRAGARTWTSSWRRSGPPAPATRAAYSRALAQRNALLARVRAGAAPARGARRLGRASWRAQGVALMADRREAVDGLRAPVRRAGRAPRAARARPSCATGRARRRPTPDEPRGRARGAPRRRPRARLHGPRPAPRRGAAAARRGGAARLRLAGPAAHRPARAAVRRARRCCAERRGRPPLMLLDDVMSELDADPPRAAGGAAARRRPGGRHRDRARATCRAPTTRGDRGCEGGRSPRAGGALAA